MRERRFSYVRRKVAPIDLRRPLLTGHFKAAEDRAARTVEIAGDEIDGVDQISGQRGAASHTGSEPSVDRGPRRRGQVARQGPNRNRVDAGVRGGGLRGERLGQCLEPIHAVGLPLRAVAMRQLLGKKHVQQRQQQVGVCVRDDAEPFELGRGLRLAGVDHNDAAAALDDVVHPVLDSRGCQEAPMGDNGIRAHQDEQIGPCQVRYRHRRRRAIQQLARDESAIGVLGGGGEVMGVAAEALDERLQPQQV